MPARPQASVAILSRVALTLDAALGSAHMGTLAVWAEMLVAAPKEVFAVVGAAGGITDARLPADRWPALTARGELPAVTRTAKPDREGARGLPA